MILDEGSEETLTRVLTCFTVPGIAFASIKESSACESRYAWERNARISNPTPLSKFLVTLTVHTLGPFH